MTQLKNIRVFVAEVPRHRMDWQSKLCAEAVAALDLPAVVYEHGKPGREADERALWLRSLQRDEVAVVPHLQVLARPKHGDMRPVVDLMLTISEAVMRSHHLLEASTGITSLDWPAFMARVSKVANLVAQGRTLTKHQARKLAKRSHAKRPPGTVATWLDDGYKARRKAAQKRWHAARSRREAWDALTDDDRASLGSMSTAMRVLEADREWQPITARKRAKAKK